MLLNGYHQVQNLIESKANVMMGKPVIAVAEMEPGIPDGVVLDRANAAMAMLITEDKDFGELAFRQSLVHHGAFGCSPVARLGMTQSFTG